jgi:hypothetical protein
VCELLTVKEDVGLGFLREVDLEEIKRSLNMVERLAKRYITEPSYALVMYASCEEK